MGYGYHQTKPGGLREVRITGAVVVVINLRNRIDDELARLDMNWAELARTLGVSHQYLHSCVRRNGSLPLKHYLAICDVFGWAKPDPPTIIPGQKFWGTQAT